MGVNVMQGAFMRCLRGALAIAVIFAIAQNGHAQPRTVVLLVIVNPASPVTNLSLAQVREIFLRQRVRWEDGSAIGPINLPVGSNERTLFEQVALGMDSRKAGEYWVDRKIRGQADAPREAGSVVLMQRVVAREAGAIGYLRPEEDAKLGRIINIDGHAPADPAYPLRSAP